MARRPSTNRRSAKWGSPSHSTEHRGKVRREQPGPARKSATASYGLCNPDPTSVACINATLSYGACIRTPERTRKSKCSLFVSCRGVLRPISATKRPDLHFCNQLHFSVHPNGIANGGVRPRSYRGAHVSALIGSYAQRLDRSHWTAGARPMRRPEAG